ncbi:hypothetical protein B0H10DRAFT_1953666 [Mycena sp. CBHHK59/15]|nr:hypothetical protein B0H10DRAFT_1953666 [Mycena sp. CBHHK59/15]
MAHLGPTHFQRVMNGQSLPLPQLSGTWIDGGRYTYLEALANSHTPSASPLWSNLGQRQHLKRVDHMHMLIGARRHAILIHANLLRGNGTTADDGPFWEADSEAGTAAMPCQCLHPGALRVTDPTRAAREPTVFSSSYGVLAEVLRYVAPELAPVELEPTTRVPGTGA